MSKSKRQRKKRMQCHNKCIKLNQASDFEEHSFIPGKCAEETEIGKCITSAVAFVSSPHHPALQGTKSRDSEILESCNDAGGGGSSCSRSDVAVQTEEDEQYLENYAVVKQKMPLTDTVVDSQNAINESDPLLHDDHEFGDFGFMVRNLPFDMEKSALLTLVQKTCGQRVSILLGVRYGRGLGWAAVFCNNELEGQHFMEKFNGFILEKRPLTIQPLHHRETFLKDKLAKAKQEENLLADNGLTLPLLKQLNIRQPTQFVKVTKIKPGIDKNSVKDLFTMYGHEIVKMFYTKGDAADSGYAYIEFATIGQAVEVIKMYNNCAFYNQVLRVAMDESATPVWVRKWGLPCGLKRINDGFGENGKPRTKRAKMNPVDRANDWLARRPKVQVKTVDI